MNNILSIQSKIEDKKALLENLRKEGFILVQVTPDEGKIIKLKQEEPRG